jgi:hypothetical protein
VLVRRVCVQAGILVPLLLSSLPSSLAGVCLSTRVGSGQLVVQQCPAATLQDFAAGALSITLVREAAGGRATGLYPGLYELLQWCAWFQYVPEGRSAHPTRAQAHQHAPWSCVCGVLACTVPTAAVKAPCLVGLHRSDAAAEATSSVLPWGQRYCRHQLVHLMGAVQHACPRHVRHSVCAAQWVVPLRVALEPVHSAVASLCTLHAGAEQQYYQSAQRAHGVCIWHRLESDHVLCPTTCCIAGARSTDNRPT